MKSVLIHVCCAHCAAYTVDYWRQQGYEVSALWYNPNIHPYTEHQHRLESMKSLAQEINLPLIITEGYDMMEYFRRVVGHESERCQYCFDLRLSKTAETARQNGFSAFTTTLLISPQQKHELIRETGNRIAEEQGIGIPLCRPQETLFRQPPPDQAAKPLPPAVLRLHLQRVGTLRQYDHKIKGEPLIEAPPLT